MDRAFDYRVPEPLAERVRAGSLVRVPLGARRVRGVVVELRDSASIERRLEDVAAVVVEPPIAPPPLDELARWVARRYVVPTGRVFERMVPARVRARVPA
ncbi:MAG: replication restart helicase PriA, partial [Actinomycetota bacterium]